jgi:hypothetical protein
VNKDLYGKEIKIPVEIKNHLKNSSMSIGETSENEEGAKRNEELQNKNSMTYQQLKRIKSWFDNYNGNKEDAPYILNGGDYMKKWVDDTLNYLRTDIYNTKKNRSEVLPNQFNSDHTKDDLTAMNRPSKSHNNPVDQYDIKITENLKRINELMKKLI